MKKYIFLQRLSEETIHVFVQNKSYQVTFAHPQETLSQHLNIDNE